MSSQEEVLLRKAGLVNGIWLQKYEIPRLTISMHLNLDRTVKLDRNTGTAVMITFGGKNKGERIQ